VKALLVAALAAGLVMAAVGTAVVASAVSLFGGGGPVVGPAASRIPPAMLVLYQEAAAASCIGLPWGVVAAIGTVESDNGQSNLPGVHSGTNPAGAVLAKTGSNCPVGPLSAVRANVVVPDELARKFAEEARRAHTTGDSVGPVSGAMLFLALAVRRSEQLAHGFNRQPSKGFRSVEEPATPLPHVQGPRHC
jgi:hypothetical protein